jgi:hypothetical protein
MDKATVHTIAETGKAVNLAAGHVAEMTGAAVHAASRAVGCPVGQAVGTAIRAAGKAWSDTAVHVANRDSARLTSQHKGA